MPTYPSLTLSLADKPWPPESGLTVASPGLPPAAAQVRAWVGFLSTGASGAQPAGRCRPQNAGPGPRSGEETDGAAASEPRPVAWPDSCPLPLPLGSDESRKGRIPQVVLYGIKFWIWCLGMVFREERQTKLPCFCFL